MADKGWTIDDVVADPEKQHDIAINADNRWGMYTPESMKHLYKNMFAYGIPVATGATVYNNLEQ